MSLVIRDPEKLLSVKETLDGTVVKQALVDFFGQFGKVVFLHLNQGAGED